MWPTTMPLQLRSDRSARLRNSSQPRRHRAPVDRPIDVAALRDHLTVGIDNHDRAAVEGFSPSTTDHLDENRVQSHVLKRSCLVEQDIHHDSGVKAAGRGSPPIPMPTKRSPLLVRHCRRVMGQPVSLS